MASLNYFPDGEAIREFFEPAVKIPLNPPLSKGDDDGFSPLASGPEGKGELEGICPKLWLNWGNREIKGKWNNGMNR